MEAWFQIDPAAAPRRGAKQGARFNANAYKL
jgi:hypothetical protein